MHLTKLFLFLLIFMSANGLSRLFAGDSDDAQSLTPPIERAFRFLIVDENDKPVDGIPFGYGSYIIERSPDGKTSEQEAAGDDFFRRMAASLWCPDIVSIRFQWAWM